MAELSRLLIFLQGSKSLPYLNLVSWKLSIGLLQEYSQCLAWKRTLEIVVKSSLVCEISIIIQWCKKGQALQYEEQ